MKNRVQQKPERSLFKTVMIGVVSAELITLVMIGILTAMMISGNINEEYDQIAVKVIHFISMLIGCLIAFAIGERKHLINGTVIVACYTGMFALINMIVFGSDFQSLTTNILAIITGMIMSLLPFIIRPKRERQKYRKQKW